MKTTLAIITLISALSASPLVAADNDKAAPSIEERLTQVELSVTIKQYEKVLLLEHEAKLQVALQNTGSEAINEKGRKTLEARIAILHDQAEKLRAMAHEYDAQIQKRREIAAADKHN